jgi:fibro-slime domain-containing protein
VALLGLLALAFPVACGAGGEDTPPTKVTNDNLPPDGTRAPGGANNPSGGSFVMEDCTGPSCDITSTANLPAPPGCGNGQRTDDEACDDGNNVSGDGCAANCLATERGFSCAAPNQPCVAIARCGDRVVAATEQCDDGNTTSGDGCSDRCRVELGSKCEGAPSVCTPTVCGDGKQEGAEACDDGNTLPFDGCSSICLKEPNCQGTSCTSECGDGIVINEECDDGNLIDGDGCSSRCTIETGFVCQPDASCDTVAGQCVLRVPAIFRDFPDSHSDFGGNACTSLATGAVAQRLNAQGRPELGPNSAAACMSTAASFADWYANNSSNARLVGDVVLFADGNNDGSYVNRYYPDGRPWTFVTPNTERNAGTSLATCQAECLNYAQNGQAPFVGQLRCDNDCRMYTDMVQRLTDQRNQAMNQNPPDLAAVATLQTQIDQAQLDGTACLTTCQTALDARVATCSATCAPCGFNPAQFCIFGTRQTKDGTPTFFPVDSITGPTRDLFPAKIPEQYGYPSFPLESTVVPGAPNHNFYFTSEVQYWFKYEANTQAKLTFLGDDDVWVFLNGLLAVDLGGIHVPSTGSVTINAAAGTVNSEVQDGRVVVPPNPIIPTRRTPTDYGLVPGNVYKITVFQAERQLDGSSFQLTLAGFEAKPSNCIADCGDGVLSFGEECDDGVNNGDYGECGPNCKLGPFCGDGVVQAEFGEDCDVGPGGDSSCRGCRVVRLR